MYSIKLPTIIVTTKNDNVFTYAVDYNITFEDILNYLKEEFKDNLKNVVLGETIGYIKNNINIKKDIKK